MLSSENGAEKTDADGAYDHGEERLEYSHGGECGEDYECGDEQCTDHLHGDHDNDARGNGKQGIVKLGFRARG